MGNRRRLYSFRPLTGIMVSNRKLAIATCYTPYSSFRPLTGIMVSNEDDRYNEYNEYF